MKLPELESAVFASNVYLKKEWVIDPPPWIIDKLRPIVVERVYAIKMKHLAEVAKIESQIKQVEARMYAETAKAMSARR
jgi:hypothetical protein